MVPLVVPCSCFVPVKQAGQDIVVVVVGVEGPSQVFLSFQDIIRDNSW
jgi:hypothetical protein